MRKLILRHKFILEFRDRLTKELHEIREVLLYDRHKINFSYTSSAIV